ncbi:thiol reductant ABC exporter subunit CydC [Devosia aquimaris]|uniref:thiol reductant ABC exporter subunit CydC n=1 Tax=Devosia aquimaris TaxID=2866214 RepID=UPI001CD18795|nr:thiol reductant ABC exporter subunit CydC [Devosia sp. CJK-A8-3]
MKALLSFFPAFRPVRGLFLLTIVLTTVTVAAGIGLLGLSGWFLTAAALSTAGAAFNLFGPSAGVRGLSFVRILSRYFEKLTGHSATLRALSDLRRWLFGRMFARSPLPVSIGRGDLVSRLMADLDALDTVFLVALGPIAVAVITGIGMSVLLALVLPVAAPLYAIGFLVATVLVPVALVQVSRKLGNQAAEAGAQLRTGILESLDGHRDLALFGALDATTDRIGVQAERLSMVKQKLGRLGSLAAAAVQMTSAIIVVGTLAAGIDAVSNGRMDGPVLVGLVLAVMASFEVSAVLVRSASRLAGSIAAAERLVDVAGGAAPVDGVAPEVSLRANAGLVFRAVDFGYDARAKVLNGVDFAIAEGECVALRGPSGAGKSTVAQLLVGLLQPLAGTIHVGGVDMAQIPLDALRRHIALMTQDAPVFHDTVRNNLLIGRPDADDTALWAVLDAVRLGEAIRSLPGGLDATLGEGGQSLSGGQARRICLARTLLSPAPVVVLDEPTTGLDPQAEAAFLADVPRLTAGRTALVITHADVPATGFRVLTLRAGHIVDQAAGTA